ncbi:hypothetical protein B7494_g590 [Chlorociboria aeruginascens]|nr:hypothetical protein B7494_g590 [Chlorociboria aeruginascens]
MDDDDFKNIGRVPYQYDDESGSAHETSSSDEVVLTTTRAKPSVSRKEQTTQEQSSEDEDDSDDDQQSVEKSHQSKTKSNPIDPRYTSDRIRENAERWAANFQAPNVDDIAMPIRAAFGSRAKKRKPVKLAPRLTKAKRLRGFYNDDYRELLNVDIEDAAKKYISEDHRQIEGSQIGASIWTSKEKDSFFSALSRLGRDNVIGVANRIGTKSVFQVQEYVSLLHEGLMEQKLQEEEPQLLFPADQPAALQIGEECEDIMDRAAEALANRQEGYEERQEIVKWGEIWLLNREVSRRMTTQRNQPGVEEAIEEAIPAANFFNLENWLELSQKVFMNPGSSREDENWEKIAEPGEEPAIRATAFEDFHSLAVSITKRLVSTTLFCTMSKLRATAAKKFKSAHVTTADVEAAVKILKLPFNSHEFWVGCPKRCALNIVQDDQQRDEPSMTYEEVEGNLNQIPVTRCRSRSRSANRRSEPESAAESESEDQDFESSESQYSSGPEPSDSDISENQKPDLHSIERKQRKIRARKVIARSKEQYLEDLDTRTSLLEEQRLWEMLNQKPPFNIESKMIETPPRPRYNKKDLGDTSEWRDNSEYWSHWETVNGPVPEELFESNKRKMARRRGRKTEKKLNRVADKDVDVDVDDNSENLGLSSEDEDDRENNGENEMDAMNEEMEKNDLKGADHRSYNSSPNPEGEEDDEPQSSRKGT